MGQSATIAFLAVIVSSSIATAQTTAVKPNVPAATRTTAAKAVVVDVPTEPAHASAVKMPATLREAAEAGDFASFDNLVRKARANGEALGAFADLYEVWSFAQSNATGAYYGAAMHDRLAARYPDYTKFIDDYRITDRRGVAFYPSAETRSFLLQQAIEGNDPLVAAAPAARQPSVTSALSSPATSHDSSSKVTLRTVAPGAIEPAELLPADALASDMSKVTPPPQARIRAQPKVAEAEMADSGTTTRGIFLIILGLIGIGVLTMTMQASSSDVHVADDETHVERPVPIAAAHGDAHPSGSQS